MSEKICWTAFADLLAHICGLVRACAACIVATVMEKTCEKLIFFQTKAKSVCFVIVLGNLEKVREVKIKSGNLRVTDYGIFRK